MMPQLVTDPLCCNSILLKNPPLCMDVNSQPIMISFLDYFGYGLFYLREKIIQSYKIIALTVITEN